ncbi:MAG: OmpA family protein [Myxococcota bacterium]
MVTSIIVCLALAITGPEGDESSAQGEATVGLGSASTTGEVRTSESSKSNEAKKSKKPKKARKAKERGDQKWIRRWAPERNTGEIGVFGGVIFPHPRLELFEPSFDRPDQGFVPLRRVSPEVGARVGYYPLRILGVEAEGAVMPTTTTTDERALVWGLRGQLVAQLPFWSVTPFALAGVSGLGVSSERDAVGNDVDLGFHYGVGVKVFLNRIVGLRLDLRDNLTARRGVGESVIHSPEVLLGLTITLGRPRSEPTLPPDTDGDGIFDPDDQCVDEPGVAEYDGCPIPDTDGDGILDPDDKCVDEPGVAAYDGCPIPDTDGDGVLDPDDACVNEPGVAEFRGCPDTDGDGIADPDDQCVRTPETTNGYKDADGCPDEVPKEIKTFTGVIKGIFFDTGKATIKAKSKPRLDKAVKVLTDYPDIRIEIIGHTDDRGDDGFNLRLSRDRAEAVKTYFIDEGIDGARIETRGAGESEPIADNRSKKGRAKNRRIEFELLPR